MNRASRIDWRLGRPGGAAAPGMSAVVCIASLDSPETAPLWGLEPTKQDIADERYPGASGRERFLERRALLRSLVASQTDAAASEIVVGYDEAGAPVLLHPPSALYVTSAGRDEIAAVAVANVPAGVDVEPVADTEPVEAVLHPRERERLGRMAGPERWIAFLHVWTMKEAYLKAMRTGLRRDPAEIEIEQIDDSEVRIVDRGHSVACIAEWKRATIFGRDIIAACVVLDG